MSDSSATRREPGRALFSVAQIQHVLRVEFGRAQRYRYPLTCLVIAIDQLGALRDAHGYDVKERVFESVVGLLRQATRTSDFLGRTADDRLLAVIPHTGLEGARTMTARLFDAVRALAFEAPIAGATITLSVGASTSEHEGLMYHDALLNSAEAALAEASAAGGDRLVEKAPI
jgi:diguanylate cyclase (GGDEF)-like protein